MVVVESLDQSGRGVAHHDGKAIFIDGALPGETVSFSSFRKKPSFELAHLTQVIIPSPARVTPRCPHFKVCGGCSLQHLDERAQVAAKQRVLEDNLKHIGKVRAEVILPATYGPSWEYRHRARFSVRYVAKKGGILIGFHEKNSSFVADMNSCEIVPHRISSLLLELRTLIGALTIYNRIPQLELAIGEESDVLVMRIMESLATRDEELLRAFAARHSVQLYLQPAGPDSVYRFYPADGPRLYYTLPEYSLSLAFEPTDFTQVNQAMNRVLVRRAMQLLQPKPQDRIADMFCGLGNFSLAMARSGGEVVGIEGSKELVERARINAQHNGLAANSRFIDRNLFAITEQDLTHLGPFDKMLIDPPRDGAAELVKALSGDLPQRIVYISCNPATLARDAGLLEHTKNYRLKAAGVVNMFPHTTHIESIALFEHTK